MPRFQVVERYPVPVVELFAFYGSLANVLAVAPPGSGMALVAESKERGKGATFQVALKRWGIKVIIETEIVNWIENQLMIEEQRKGPFASWRLERRFRRMTEGESELTETIEFEPPGGLLGLTMTASRIEAELRGVYEGRCERVLKEMRG